MGIRDAFIITVVVKETIVAIKLRGIGEIVINLLKIF